MRRGFTLIELLISLSILVLVAGSLVATFAGGSRVWERVQCGETQEQMVMLAFDDFKRQLHNFQAFSLISFDGQNDKMSFPTVMTYETELNFDDEPEERGKKTFRERREPGRVRYSLDEKNGIICREDKPFRFLKRGESERVCKTIAPNVERMTFKYYVYNDESKNYRWASSWKSDKPPLMVKIELRYHNECSEETIERSFMVTIPAAKVG